MGGGKCGSGGSAHGIFSSGSRILIVLALVLSLLLPAPGRATMPGSNGRRIAFTAWGESGSSDIYLIDRDGGRRKNLTKDLPWSFMTGPWSPDGKSMLLTSNRDAVPVVSWTVLVDTDIYVFAPRTGELRELTATRDAAELEPVWSPDGTQVAFSVARSVGSSGLVDRSLEVMDTDGTDRREVAEGFEPSWSPDGTRIAFSAWPREPDESIAEIVTVTLDGTNRSVLTESEFSGEPDWSPDGTQLVYTSVLPHNRSSTMQSDLVVMNADGSDPRRLTWTRGGEGSPVWSPDGRFIVFSREVRDGDPDVETSEIFRMRVSTRSVRRLTHMEKTATSPHWRPAVN